MNWEESGGIFYSSHFNMSYAGGPAQVADLNAIASSICGQWNTNWVGNFSPQIVLVGASTLDLSSATGLTGAATSGNAGTNASAPVESGTAIHLRFKIATRYRGGHPGIYLPPGHTAAVVQPSSWLASYLTTIVNAWNSMITAIKGLALTSVNSLSQVAVSYFKGPIQNTDPSPWDPKNVPKYRATPVVYPVTTVVGTPLIASQRRRRQSTGA
jgi:hypothetical protein